MQTEFCTVESQTRLYNLFADIKIKERLISLISLIDLEGYEEE